MRKQFAIPHAYDETTKEAWALIWSWKRVLPRIRAFLWKGIHNGFPTASTLNSRIRSITHICQRCNSENEYLMHLLFFCDLSRATWYISDFPMIVEHLAMQFPAAIAYITRALNEDQIIVITNLIWCLWKARNEEIFAAKKLSPQEIVTKAKAMLCTI